MLSIFDGFLEVTFVPLYAITFLIALWRYPKYYDTALKYFPILLFYTFLTELLGMIIRYTDIDLFVNEYYANNNLLIFNIYYIVSFLFFFVVYHIYLSRPQHKTVTLILIIFFAVTAIINAVTESFLFAGQVYTYVAGGLGTLVCTSLYLIENKKERQHWLVQRDLLSWISLGMLIFFLVYTPIKIIKQYWYMIGETEHPLSRRIHLSVLIFMYVCFILGFLKMDRFTLKRKINS